MLDLLRTVIYFPLLNTLVFIYNYIPDIGVAIILLTLVIRIILAPSHQKSLKGQQAMNALQPKLNELREKHKDNKEAQAREMMNLYKEHKVNPLSSCLPMLIQLPILIGLFYVFRDGLANNLNGIYSFIPRPEHIDPMFFGIIDLSQKNIYLAILAGLAQLWQSKLMQPKTPGQDTTSKIMRAQTTYILPVITVVFGYQFPAGLPLYWLVTTLFAVGQQYYIMRKHPELVRK